MAIYTGLGRIGKDAELRYTPSGKAVINLALAFSYGQKDPQTGYKPTQWVEAALWDKQAEALAQYLLKGKQVDVVLADVHNETYQGNNGQGTKLVGRVMSIEFASDGQQAGGQRQQAQQPPQRQQLQQTPMPTAGGGGFSDMDDDIPFAPLAARMAWSIY